MKFLRPYQDELLQAARLSFHQGARSLMVQLATGGGKSLCAATMARHHAARGGSVLALVHRHELAEQLRATFAEQCAPAQIDSLQRLLASGDRPDASLVILDEARHTVSEKWFTVGQHYLARAETRAVVGFDATPCRQDGKALGNLFDNMISGPSIKWLTAQGFLVPCDVFGPAGRKQALAARPVDAYREHAAGQQTIVYCRDVKHAEAEAAAFNAAGIPAACVEGNMPDAARAEAFAAFRAGRLLVLTNCMLCTEGLDVPSMSCVIIARGCSSVGTYLQIVGRVLRPWPGKARALVLDLTGAWADHGLPDDDRFFSLEGKPIRLLEGDAPLSIAQCRACGGVYRCDEFQAGACPRCGAARAAKKDPRIQREALQQIRASHTEARRVEALADLIGQAREKKYRSGWWFHRFRARYGAQPTPAEIRAAVDVLNARASNEPNRQARGETAAATEAAAQKEAS